MFNLTTLTFVKYSYYKPNTCLHVYNYINFDINFYSYLLWNFLTLIFWEKKIYILKLPIDVYRDSNTSHQLWNSYLIFNVVCISAENVYLIFSYELVSKIPLPLQTFLKNVKKKQRIKFKTLVSVLNDKNSEIIISSSITGMLQELIEKLEVYTLKKEDSFDIKLKILLYIKKNFEKTYSYQYDKARHACIQKYKTQYELKETWDINQQEWLVIDSHIKMIKLVNKNFLYNL